MRHLSNKYVSPELILNAFMQGFFPMADERGEIGFYAHEMRGLVPLDDRFVIRRSFRQILKKKNFHVTFDQVPQEVLRACSREGEIPSHQIWLSEELIEHCMTLFKMGYVHTVEVWKHTNPNEDKMSLVGGLYGLTLGGAFCGESMFSREPYASQIALVSLVERLRSKGFQLLDAQMASDHLKQFGLFECSHAEYLRLFNEAAIKQTSF